MIVTIQNNHAPEIIKNRKIFGGKEYLSNAPKDQRRSSKGKRQGARTRRQMWKIRWEIGTAYRSLSRKGQDPERLFKGLKTIRVEEYAIYFFPCVRPLFSLCSLFLWTQLGIKLV